VGSGAKPIPLCDEEAQQIIITMGMEEPRTKIDFAPGEQIRVIHGPFENYMGIVEEILLDKNKLTVLISMFGRETPVELDYNQVEKLV